MTYDLPTDVFTLDGEAWQIRIGDHVPPTTWSSRGAAVAGLAVECRRRGVHQLSRDCWCQPQIIQP